MTDAHQFVKEVLCTDNYFGWDGQMYVSDWSNEWESDRTGQILTLSDPTRVEEVNIRVAQNSVRTDAKKDPTDLILQLVARLELARRGTNMNKALSGIAMHADDAPCPGCIRCGRLLPHSGRQRPRGPEPPTQTQRSFA